MAGIEGHIKTTYVVVICCYDCWGLGKAGPQSKNEKKKKKRRSIGNILMPKFLTGSKLSCRSSCITVFGFYETFLYFYSKFPAFGLS